MHMQLVHTVHVCRESWWPHMAGGTSDPPAGNPTSRPSSKGSRGNVTSPHNTQHTGKRKTQDIKLNVRNKKKQDMKHRAGVTLPPRTTHTELHTGKRNLKTQDVKLNVRNKKDRNTEQELQNTEHRIHFLFAQDTA